ncbi:MAG: aminotransferase class III-fold pyridoxal phosphate-dependent enzyme, partial [Bacteroidia bacterium]|nr:aminotransferase class III-fold pyridoxal phosphate-dependent enzyme [Bacteroidia bacterium]
ALASLDLFDQPETQANIDRITKKHEQFFQKIKGHPALIDVRQLGTIIAFEIKNEEQTNYLNSLSERISSFFISKGIILRPLGNIVYVLPPYCIQDEDLDYIYNAIELFFEELANRK